VSDFFVRRSHPARRLILELEALNDRVAPGGAAGGVADACPSPVVCRPPIDARIAQTADAEKISLSH
jgi:hypothetical protein